MIRGMAVYGTCELFLIYIRVRSFVIVCDCLCVSIRYTCM